MIAVYSVIVWLVGAHAHLLVHKTNTVRTVAQDPHIKNLNVTFNSATVTFKLNGVPVKEEKDNIHPNNIEEALSKYACNQERPTFKVGPDGLLELSIEYACQMDHNDDHSRTLYIVLIVGLLVVVMTAGVLAKRAVTTDGEISWRMWRVPLRRHLSPEECTEEPSGSNVATKTVDKVYNDTTLSDKLSRTMIGETSRTVPRTEEQ